MTFLVIIKLVPMARELETARARPMYLSSTIGPTKNQGELVAKIGEYLRVRSEERGLRESYETGETTGRGGFERRLRLKERVGIACPSAGARIRRSK